MRGMPLQHVVHHAEELLIVRAAGLRAVELIKVDHFIERHEQAVIAGKRHETSEQLEAVIEADIIDDVPHPKLQHAPRCGSRTPPEASEGRRVLPAWSPSFIGASVASEDGCEIEAEGELLERREPHL